ncbi:hypothetical protein EGR_06920 [Echinococcus granulosus]|uniref:Uncharacterized protein n=1 Tax=Echinococcus granulosus TaxID=6210 RepID=W6UC50_ECHGR|nr:hypothetical protein EGR_06920 [Echinococcus granulosus]EUB58176.1 hypothetical protein EGR_06920 [Echinococcus granulosus]
MGPLNAFFHCDLKASQTKRPHVKQAQINRLLTDDDCTASLPWPITENCKLRAFRTKLMTLKECCWDSSELKKNGLNALLMHHKRVSNDDKMIGAYFSKHFYELKN